MKSGSLVGDEGRREVWVSLLEGGCEVEIEDGGCDDAGGRACIG